jgi:prepilin-type N-terminal cleavage/methylation domain-containing protein
MVSTTFRSRAAEAFTLVEMLVVVLILGILAAVVVPKFASASDSARTAAVQSTVGGVRAGIAAFRTRAVIAGDNPFPTLAELTSVGTVMQDKISTNPFTGVGGVQAVSQAQAEARSVTGTTAGWNYYYDNDASPPVAIFYANSDATSTESDGSGGYLGANEL